MVVVMACSSLSALVSELLSGDRLGEGNCMGVCDLSLGAVRPPVGGANEEAGLNEAMDRGWR